MRSRRKPWAKAAGEHLLGELVRGRVVGAAGDVDDVEQRRRVKAGAHAEDHRLGGDGDRARRHQVVDHLGRLTLPGLRRRPRTRCRRTRRAAGGRDRPRRRARRPSRSAGRPPRPRDRRSPARRPRRRRGPPNRLTRSAPSPRRSSRGRHRPRIAEPPAKPSGPSATSCTTSGRGRLTITTGAASATSRGVCTTVAPALRAASRAAGSGSQTTRAWPAAQQPRRHPPAHRAQSHEPDRGRAPELTRSPPDRRPAR